MSLPLPNLDDRRWSDLVEEGRALIPLFEREWSDHNIHDPGIMLLELLAWVTEMDIYWLNRVPESHRRKFLALAGFRPAPPRPARAVLHVLLKDGASPLLVPPGLLFEGDDAFDRPAAFRTLHPITLAPGRLWAVQRREGNHWSDLTDRWARGETFTPFGDDPQPGATFYLGFSHALPEGKPVTLYFALAGDQATAAVRQQLEAEFAHQLAACHPPHGLVDCPPNLKPSSTVRSKPERQDGQAWQHHSARLTWEYLDAGENWRPLSPQAGEIWDGTRAVTLSGRVIIQVPGQMKDKSLGQVGKSLFYVRCRLERGAFDAPPQVQNLALNGVLAEQAAHLETQTWPIAPQAKIEGPEPVRGEPIGFKAVFDTEGQITELEFDPEGQPGFRVLNYRPPEGEMPGRLVLEAKALPPGDGRPLQTRSLPEASVLADSLRLVTWEGGEWRAWQAVDDLNASSRADAHFLLDPETGELHFGDGEQGRALPIGAWPLVSYRATRAEDGNLPAGSITRLLDTAHNRALLDGKLHTLREGIAEIGNPLPATGGVRAETVEEASARALQTWQKTERAVNVEDYQTLAKQTPGVRLARAAVLPNKHPAHLCMQAPGVITLVVLPCLPADRPMPSPGLLRAVQAYLASREVLGTRVEVVGPHYTPVKVVARAQACAGENLVTLQTRIGAALNRFFHPLRGGPDEKGWPFGRDIYRSEVLQLIDEVPGVDHVLSLKLLGADGQPGCGNLCLGPLGLPAAGEHQIEVV